MTLYELTVLILVLVMLGGAAAVISLRTLLSAAIAEGIVSLVLALLFLLMSAPDVAITQAVIGAGLSTALYLWSLRRMETGSARDGKEAANE